MLNALDHAISDLSSCQERPRADRELGHFWRKRNPETIFLQCVAAGQFSRAPSESSPKNINKKQTPAEKNLGRREGHVPKFGMRQPEPGAVLSR
ncbi:hypothetical protein [Paracoccus sp. M683]|uniref:hypothetical protein n=1 Tax=Paracoccus sp. M683 TaxID=2594268 RepID=UPI001C8F599A|nr:hypothetical protein [Paracoccus sp. M683]